MVTAHATPDPDQPGSALALHATRTTCAAFPELHPDTWLALWALVVVSVVCASVGG